MARDKVFGTYELQEQIILHLPVRQIVRARVINKSFYDITEQSSRIRRALFLEPFTPVTLSPHKGCRDHGLYDPRAVDWREQEKEIATTPLLNPFISVHRQIRMMEYAGESLCFHGANESMPCQSVTWQHLSYRDATLQLRHRMLLTHPPITSMSVTIQTGRWVDSVFTIENADGIRLSDLVDRMATSERIRRGTLIGGDRWIRLVRAVDEVSGHDMLRLLRLSVDDELLKTGQKPIERSKNSKVASYEEYIESQRDRAKAPNG